MHKKLILLVTLFLFITACNPAPDAPTPAPASEKILTPTLTPYPTLENALSLPSITSTTQSDSNNVALNEMDHCIQPLVFGSYPLFCENLDFIPSEEDVFPYGWEEISTIPDELFTPANNLELIFTKHFKEYDELWFTHFTGAKNRLISFQTDTKQWLVGPNISTKNLFLDNEENIWMLESGYNNYQPKIFRLNQNSFIEIPINDEDNRSIKGIINGLEVDREGTFWFILEDETGITHLYNYSPINKISKFQLTVEFFYKYFKAHSASIVFDENNVLYFMKSHDMLMRFDPASREISETDIPWDYYAYGSPSLFIDNKNRLWISDTVWIDLSLNDIRIQNIIIQSPVFIDFIEYVPQFSWVKPAIFLESKDGRLWSISRRGQAWFDHDSGEWCLFSSFERNIVKDSHGNLWTLINDTLYRLNQ